LPTTVRLDARTEAALARLAKKTGRTKSQVIRDAIEHMAHSDALVREPESAYEAMQHVVGCADSGGAQLSDDTGRKFRDLLTRRRGRRSR
jgi:predicted DNA-binding protein